MEEELLILFRKGVQTIADDEDYYSRAFNEGIRLCYEEKRTKHPIVTAELILAAERFKEWSGTTHPSLTKKLIERYASNQKY